MLDRLLARFGYVPARRSLDAAGGGRRWSDDRRVTPNAVNAMAGTVGARAAHFAMNTPLGSRIVESLVSNIVGTGIKPRSGAEQESTRARLHRRWSAWTDEADADGRGDFYALQSGLVRDMVVFGEGLAVWSNDPATGAPTLRRLHPDQLDRSWTRQGPSGLIVAGVEFDRAGRIVAYHIRPNAPGDPLAVVTMAPERVPAGDVVHMFRSLLPGQVRGMSSLAPLLLPARELDSLADAMLVRAKVAALFAGVVTDPDGQSVADGDQVGSTLDVSLEPGALVSLPPGKSVEFADAPDQGGASALMTSTLRLIAAGANIPYEVASGDYSQTNYSSARAALLEYRRFVETVQHHTVVFGLCRPAWQRFSRWQVLTGGLSASAYAADRSTVEAVSWLPPRFDQVDPIKDTNAAVAQIRNGLKSRAEFVAERGIDIEDLDREMAADAARLAKLGIPDPNAAKAGAA